MVEKIYEAKRQVLDYMERQLSKGGTDRMNVTEMGMLADIVKDLAEAEKECWEASYYRTVTEAMETQGSGTSGYTRMGYSSPMESGRRGYGSGSAANGGTMMGHSDPVAAIRDMLATASPELRMQIRNELSNLMM